MLRPEGCRCSEECRQKSGTCARFFCSNGGLERDRGSGGQPPTGCGRNNMNGSEVLRIVDAIHRDKNIDKEIVFEGIEQAIISAARKHFGEESPLEVHIDRE